MWKQSYLDGGNPWGVALDFSRQLPFQKKPNILHILGKPYSAYPVHSAIGS